LDSCFSEGSTFKDEQITKEGRERFQPVSTFPFGKEESEATVAKRYRAAAEYSVHSLKHFQPSPSQQTLEFCMPSLGSVYVRCQFKTSNRWYIQWKAFSALPYMVTATTVPTGDTEVLHESTAWLANICFCMCFLSINSYDIIHTVYISNSCLRSVLLQ